MLSFTISNTFNFNTYPSFLRSLIRSNTKEEGQETKKTVNLHIVYHKVGARTVIATIRDPIDHFLSGWAECGKRGNLPPPPPAVEASTPASSSLSPAWSSYDTRVRQWLAFVQQCTTAEAYTNNNKACYDCAAHSYPQTAFLLDQHVFNRFDRKQFLSNIVCIGDLQVHPRNLFFYVSLWKEQDCTLKFVCWLVFPFFLQQY